LGRAGIGDLVRGARRHQVNRLIAAPHGPLRPTLNESSLDLALDYEGDVPTRAVSVRWDAAAGFEEVDVGLHVLCLMDECLVGQDVVGLLEKGRKVEDRHG